MKALLHSFPHSTQLCIPLARVRCCDQLESSRNLRHEYDPFRNANTLSPTAVTAFMCLCLFFLHSCACARALAFADSHISARRLASSTRVTIQVPLLAMLLLLYHTMRDPPTLSLSVTHYSPSSRYLSSFLLCFSTAPISGFLFPLLQPTPTIPIPSLISQHTTPP